MKHNIQQRLEKLRRSISEKKIDTCLVLSENNRRYLSGFTGEDHQFDESAGALFINDSKLILATDSRYELQAGKEASFYDIVCYKEGLAKKIPDILKLLKTKRLGFESKRISHLQFNKISEELKSNRLDIELVAIDTIIENHRKIKSEEEICEIKKALLIAETGFAIFFDSIKSGITEKEAAWSLEKELREAGGDSLAFPVICAAGTNSALPHAIPGDDKLENGIPLLFDWGVKTKGYASDISRTHIIGKPDETFLKVFNTVETAQAKAIKAIKPGISGKDIDKIAREYIENNGFKGKFRHGLGHGVGLAVHEDPVISPLRDTIIEPQMVFTVEPGIYIPGWGGVRIENMVVVREDGAEILNKMETGWK